MSRIISKNFKLNARMHSTFFSTLVRSKGKLSAEMLKAFPNFFSFTYSDANHKLQFEYAESPRTCVFLDCFG